MAKSRLIEAIYTSRLGGKDQSNVRVVLFLVRVLDNQLAVLSQKEKIQALTEILQDGNNRYLDAEILLDALENIFSSREGFAPDPQEAVLFRAHLMDLYKFNKASGWKSLIGPYFETPPIGFLLLAKILKGWDYEWHYSTNPATKIFNLDAEICFQFVCDEYAKIVEEYSPEAQKKIEEIFFRQIELRWQSNDLNSWIIKAPDGVAKILLKQRTRTMDVEELKEEIFFLSAFEFFKRSGKAIELAQNYFPAIIKTDNMAQQLIEQIAEVAGKTSEPDISIGYLSGDVIRIEITFPFTKSQKVIAHRYEIEKAMLKIRDIFEEDNVVELAGRKISLDVNING